MNRLRRFFAVLCAAIVSSVLLASCGSQPNNAANPASTAGAQASASLPPQQSASAEAELQTRTYTDSKGHTVEIPVRPQRVVYTGGEPGDILALGVKPVGAALGIIAEQVAYPDMLEGIADVGDLLGDLEKVAALEPDLILLDSGGSYYEEGAFENLSKIAPTVTYDRLSTNERLRVFGDLLDKKRGAEDWIAGYEEKSAKVRERLGASSEATATVYLQLGTDLWLMGDSGFAATLYGTLGYAPAPKVKAEMIDQNQSFAQVSSELLPDYAGDWLFVLTDQDETARAATDSFASAAVWKSIAAVENGQVFYIPTKWNFDDAITKERLLDELPVIMNK
ncbi:ABC transporter substrate-binding protein [Cohnella algarum]|uniref:ABC transporter substrate-binding protein n=1 Tax=Cohnella algarum TaxID=2044859 RepID=UPI001967983D|nr:ABC transporter substrate-binding protein [Cohnella algarum]MBN2982527.1 ABC transporter substrate-binding protein [Cohnella algarum]